MDYKDKYNKLVEAIKVLQETNPSDEGIQNWVNDNVPELAESEDALTWLKTYIEEEAYYLSMDIRDEEDRIKLKKLQNALDWLKKQGEQKPYGQKKECLDCQFNYAGECKGSCQIKRDEQKPADKVKPKFKVGDWIVDNRTGVVHYISKIKGTVGGCYYILGYDKGLLHIDNESDYHLWTIQDAKDGDIVCAEPTEGWVSPFIAIYKRGGIDTFDSYCIVDFDGNFDEGLDGHDANNIHPATKEQRNLLFQKMREAGYIFDFEKKELKKLKFKVGDEVIPENEESLTITRIDEEGYWSNDLFICDFDSECSWDLVEQKSAEWKQENREELTEFENAMMHIGCSFFGENAGLDPNDSASIKEQAELLLELVPKTEWSEKDESMYTRILGILGKCYMGELPTKVEEELKWFKSIKQKICG